MNSLVRLQFIIPMVLVLLLPCLTCKDFPMIEPPEPPEPPIPFCPEFVLDEEGNPVLDNAGRPYETHEIKDRIPGSSENDSICQCWMARNLNIGIVIDSTSVPLDNDTIEMYCPYNDPAYCDEFGAIYSWTQMMNHSMNEGSQGICPTGWHIPTDGEWRILERALGMTESEVTKIEGWRHLGSSGADVLFDRLKLGQGYHRYENGKFLPHTLSNDLRIFFWTSSLEDGTVSSAIHREFSLSWGANGLPERWERSDSVRRRFNSLTNGHYIRCIKD